MKKHWFKFVLLALVCILSVAVWGLLDTLWNSMVEYEAASEIGAVTEYFERFAQGDYDTAADTCGMEFTEKVPREDYIRYLQETFGSDFSDLRFAGRDGDKAGEKLYRIYSGNTALGTVRLIPVTGQSRNWHVVSEVEYADPILVNAPETVTVTANGIPVKLPEDAPKTPDEDFKLLEQVLTVPQRVSYTVEGYLYAPVIAGTAPDGTPCLSAVDENGTIVLTVPPTEAQAAEYETVMKDFATVYACFIAKDAAFGKVAAKMDRNTPFYEAVRTFSNYWYNTHNGYEFRNWQISEMVRPADGLFAGTIRFDHVVFWKGEEKIYHSAYRLCFRQVNGVWLLVDLKMI